MIILGSFVLYNSEIAPWYFIGVGGKNYESGYSRTANIFKNFPLVSQTILMKEYFLISWGYQIQKIWKDFTERQML
jgi:hypothetical protein